MLGVARCPHLTLAWRGLCPHLTLGVAGVPQSVAQVLAGPRGGVHHLEGHAGVAVGAGGLVLPVGLRDLLPHHHIEAAAGLVAEDEAGVVIVPVGVDVKRAAEVDRPKLIKTWCQGNIQSQDWVGNSLWGDARLAWDPRMRTGRGPLRLRASAASDAGAFNVLRSHVLDAGGAVLCHVALHRPNP